jgi:GH15 family glucan-1,4-alpha-glucosidase
MKHLEDYALLANCKTAALVDRQGSIDWLCAPRFDSGACFAAMLGTPEHGRWQLYPHTRVLESCREYRTDTFTLENHLVTETGRVVITDCLCMNDDEDDSVTIIRQVRCTEGKVSMAMELAPRFNFGLKLPLLEQAEDCAHFICGPDQVVVYTEQKLQLQDHSVAANFTLEAGQISSFQMSWTPSHKSKGEKKDVERELKHTDNFWSNWINNFSVEDQEQHPKLVRRSLMLIKALTYRATGSIVAAPTTSLPEILGGKRNWDYRYCWPRDAALAMHAIINSDEQSKEVDHWRHWLMRASAGVPHQLEVLYGLLGERPDSERELDWLPGMADSAPVRVGNEAHDQLQLDIFGYVIEVFYAAEKLGLPHLPQSWKFICKILNYLESVWQCPDEGIWEVRGPKRHFVHSKVMVWSAYNWGIKAHEEFGLDGPVDKWRKIRDAVFAEICDKGFDQERNSFVQFYGSKDVDASLLMIPLVGFLPADDPRMKGTVKAIEEDLLIEEGLIQRYRESEEVEGMPPGGNRRAFLLCSAWLGINYVMQGDKQRGERVLQKLCKLTNDVGLLSEQYDPTDKRLLGNFPQTFSHIGLIMLELTIREGAPRLY